MIEALRTPRLMIRRFAPEDYDDFAAYHAHPLVRRYMPGEPMDPERAARYLADQAVLDERELKRWHGYAVVLTATGTVIGDVGVFLASAEEGDIGFQFHPAHHRRGYGREAMTAFLGYVFGTLDLTRVTAGCDRGNEASAALLTRLGLRRQTPDAVDGALRFAMTRP
ncbi:GNAT family N-acetyltransferase [Catenuloplanes japonicus]|uniref:GNAT family N-acetyltransferase n=1 Tax=Catenuloplanes japonicus TaxID=33876 RepID=UPI000691F77E|nr:GNAT family N-acetyltransferase [Catenuloplanes japonicus]